MINNEFDDLFNQVLDIQQNKRSKKDQSEQKKNDIIENLSADNLEDSFRYLLNSFEEKEFVTKHNKFEVVIGDKYGSRTIIANANKLFRTYVICKCDCGSIDTVSLSKLKKGKADRCIGCHHKSTVTYPTKFAKIGDKYGERTIIEAPARIKGDSNTYKVKCICICQKESWITFIHLRRSKATMCYDCTLKKLNREYYKK